MKNTSKFLAVMLAITGLFCCAVAVGIGAGFNAVRESTDKKIIAVAEKVREQYPDISEKELAQILNSDTAGIKGDSSICSRYSSVQVMENPPFLPKGLWLVSSCFL